MIKLELPPDLANRFSAEQRRIIINHLEDSREPICVLNNSNAPIEASDSALDNNCKQNEADSRYKTLASINFSHVNQLLESVQTKAAPRALHGLFIVCMSPQFKRFESKDRSCFSIRWNPSTAPHAVSQILGHRIEPRIDYVFSPGLTQQIIAPEEITQPVYEQLLNWINSHNKQALEHSYFFFPHHARLAEAKLISAFSSNGIGFTPARANDSCYAHLVEAADSWSLLGCLKLDEKIDEGKQFNDLTGPTELLLMIEKNDLEADRLDKCFIVRYWD